MKKSSLRHNGLTGTFFEREDREKVVVVLGGSSGGIPESRAEKLARSGISSLALAYFAAENLPKFLKEIPMEYFENAFSYLENLGYKKIALWGGSRGAEAALILGTLFPDRISAIVAHVPTSAIFGSFEENEQDAWLYRGRPIAPFAPFQYLEKAQGITPDDPIEITPSFLQLMHQSDFERAKIPVEKLRCPLLLISAEDDQMWPSFHFANQIVERLKSYDSPIYCSHLSYKDVGHSPAKGEMGLHPLMNRWFAYGGNPLDNKKAAALWIEETVKFFQKHF